MPRTTLNIEQPVLRKLKQLQKQSGKPLGAIVSELLLEAFAIHGQSKPADFGWTVMDMGTPMVDLRDKEALANLLDAK